MRKIALSLLGFVMGFSLLFFHPVSVFATASYEVFLNTQNTDTGYEAYIMDSADLLSFEEEQALLESVQPILSYGNVAFLSLSDNPSYSTKAYARDCYYELFSYDSGCLFIIDMDERMIWLETGGDMNSIISSSYALTITDNVYSHASSGDYFSCATDAFEQVLSLLEGSRISQPMKYISNALLAVVLALLLNYVLVMLVSRSNKPSERQIINSIYSHAEVKNPTMHLLNQTKRFSPQSSNSSGVRSAGRMGGGGFGGGGRSSGGGHRF